MKKTPKHFEDAMARLETITQNMQKTDLPLEDALKNYEEGQELIRYCQEKLAVVEQKLQVLDQQELGDLKLEE